MDTNNHHPGPPASQPISIEQMFGEAYQRFVEAQAKELQLGKEIDGFEMFVHSQVLIEHLRVTLIELKKQLNFDTDKVMIALAQRLSDQAAKLNKPQIVVAKGVPNRQ